MEGHRALRRVEHEEFGPHEPQQRDLVGDLQVREERNVPGPLHGGEEQPGGQLAYVVYAHDVVALYALAVPARGVRFRA